MKKIFLPALLLILFSFQQENVIPWKENRKLTWDDFKASPNESSKYKALTESIINIAIAGKGLEATVTVEANFDKSTSWVKERTTELLKHEQGHFDIVEIWARKFKQKRKGKTYNVKTFQKELNELYGAMNRDSKTMQIEYDRETEHSVNTREQEKWNKKIAADLKSLSEFTAPSVSCKLVK